MAIVDELKRLSCAEEFFARLEVAYQPEVLAPARLHILRRMGQTLAATTLEGLAEDQVEARCRAALAQAYADFAASSPLEQRVFKVHRDARRALLFKGPRRR